MGKHPIEVELVNRIIDLRKRGHSIPEMHRLLRVSKSTLSRYIKGVEILPEYKERWLERRNASKIISEKTWEVAREQALLLVERISERELKLLGATLYWAEGAKRQFNFINSDPQMIKLFLLVLLNAFKVRKSNIKISIRLFEDISSEEALNFWSEITGFKLDENTEINVVKGKKQGKLPYGMCRVRVKRGGLLLKTLSAINKRVIDVAIGTFPVKQSRKFNNG